MTYSLSEWREMSQRVDVPGAGTRVWECGGGDPVLCVHGVPASAYLYRHLLPELARRGLRGIAFDFPGLGLADRPAQFDYSWSGLSAWLQKLTERMELTGYHLVVHDIGGPIGFDLIRRAPERVKSLTVLNTLVDVSTFKPPLVMRPFRWKMIGEVYLALLNRFTLAPLMRAEGTLRRLSALETANYAALLKMDDGGKAFLKIMRGFELTAEFEQRIKGALDPSGFPAQIIWGEQDPALPVRRYAPSVSVALKTASLRLVPGKHFVQEDSHVAIAEAVAKLAGAPSSAKHPRHGYFCVIPSPSRRSG